MNMLKRLTFSSRGRGKAELRLIRTRQNLLAELSLAQRDIMESGLTSIPELVDLLSKVYPCFSEEKLSIDEQSARLSTAKAMLGKLKRVVNEHRLSKKPIAQVAEAIDKQVKENESLPKSGNATGPSMNADERTDMHRRASSLLQRLQTEDDFEGKEHVTQTMTDLSRLLEEAENADRVEQEGGLAEPSKIKSRRDFLLTSSVAAAVGAVALVPAHARAGWFGEEAAAIIAALWTFAGKLWEAMNKGVQEYNKMAGDLGAGLSAIEEKLHVATSLQIDAGAKESDKSLTALGAHGDKIVEQMTANERVNASFGSQPSSAVCGDDITNAIHGTLERLVSGETEAVSKKQISNTIIPKRDDQKTDGENKRREMVKRIRGNDEKDTNPNNWSPQGLSYSATIAPGAVHKGIDAQEAGGDFRYWFTQDVPGGYFEGLDADYLKSSDTQMAAMLFTVESRSSVATHAIDKHRMDEVASEEIFLKSIAYLKENVRVQKQAIAIAKTADKGSSGGEDVAVSKTRLAFSQQTLEMYQKNAVPIVNASGKKVLGLSRRAVERLKVMRWNDPSYNAYLNSTGPNPTPLIRDQIRLSADTLSVLYLIKDEMAMNTDIQAGMLKELLDSNTIRRDASREAYAKFRT
jgi:hypothetical protein